MDKNSKTERPISCDALALAVIMLHR